MLPLVTLQSVSSPLIRRQNIPFDRNDHIHLIIPIRTQLRPLNSSPHKHPLVRARRPPLRHPQNNLERQNIIQRIQRTVHGPFMQIPRILRPHNRTRRVPPPQHHRTNIPVARDGLRRGAVDLPRYDRLFLLPKQFSLRDDEVGDEVAFDKQIHGAGHDQRVGLGVVHCVDVVEGEFFDDAAEGGVVVGDPGVADVVADVAAGGFAGGD
ncbi:uncharacterized protein EV422DRAFT_70658 [Fimicolochytrium jonesii]|uniref:uncharacterized protein n=1 Tax=Fimicolochytrium jonesii TaxID=1396493 RepID=UPI0022FF2C98|nr:uncharacterized protein EV422DRAFT_70658 [Fimicolochytrium jonesii]KAI8820449.1 hypothetical protein EV422DRAFT_70658 [Fimicolochytrium jonesii]